jgi:hypothetical protein
MCEALSLILKPENTHTLSEKATYRVEKILTSHRDDRGLIFRIYLKTHISQQQNNPI